MLDSFPTWRLLSKGLKMSSLFSQQWWRYCCWGWLQYHSHWTHSTNVEDDHVEMLFRDYLRCNGSCGWCSAKPRHSVRDALVTYSNLISTFSYSLLLCYVVRACVHNDSTDDSCFQWHDLTQDLRPLCHWVQVNKSITLNESLSQWEYTDKSIKTVITQKQLYIYIKSNA